MGDFFEPESPAKAGFRLVLFYGEGGGELLSVGRVRGGSSAWSCDVFVH